MKSHHHQHHTRNELRRSSRSPPPLPNACVTSDADADEEEARERAYKLVAYVAVGFSLVAILAVALCLPVVYNFVDHIQRQTKRELQFCKVGGQNI